MSWRRAIVLLVVGGLCVCGTLPLSAADKPATAAAPGDIIYPGKASGRTEPAPGRGSTYGAVLAIAALLAGTGGWLFWRGRLTPGGAVPLRKLAIAETKSLGNRQYLVVASYENKKYLLGVCPGRIDLLTALDGSTSEKSS